MNTRTVKQIIAFVVWVVAAAADVLAGGPDSGATNGLSIGERVWPPVSNGVVFVDGRYIPPPYVISRKEDWIFVNGHEITWTLPWPPKKKTPPPPPPKEMPAIPSTITTNTTPYDKEYIAYISDSRQYLVSRHGEIIGNEMMANIYRDLPCVKEAKLDPHDPRRVTLIWIDGEQYNISPPS